MKCSISWALTLVPLVASIYTNGNITAPCDSEIYCYGDMLREIGLARPFEDSKLFVDLPTLKPSDEVLAAFQNLSRPIQNNTELQDFLTENFGVAGGELEEVPVDQLETSPDFLDNVNSSTVANFTSQVIDIWPQLTRRYVERTNCTGCDDSFLPVNRTFVIAGGRFREPYYWDSFWIVEGLLRTKGSFTQIAENIIENFLDFVEEFGFVPNGARKYYLNRSQPPLLAQMVRVYVEYTQNTTLLERALPLLEKEHEFWVQNRTVVIEVGGTNYSLNNYEVDNNQPRPESYREDYETATNGTFYNEEGKTFNVTTPLTDEEIAELYSNLASGAESGFDYTSRWIANPNDAITDTFFPLRSLNTRNIIPVELNSILYHNEITIAEFHRREGNYSAAKEWANLAQERSEAMLAVLWDEEHFSYFDYNLTSGAKDIYIPADNSTVADDESGAPEGQQVAFAPSQFYPFWSGAAPDGIKNNPTAIRRAFARIEELLDDRAGAIAASNLQTGQQWDEPNVWPPLQYILIKGLMNTPYEVPTQYSGNTTDEDYVWAQNLALRLAQRYLDSTFCTWRSTGGQTPDFPQLEGVEEGANGTMFEKYADTEINAVGGGGEYEVVTGFGWTNGVLIWAVDQFGQQLTTPDCGNITAAHTESSAKVKRRSGPSAVYLPKNDAKWVKRFN
ncbi:glycoside hydrolase family 37 protein [Aaosphaeria arxii CBS 175.79]|uniref:Trehalase n=1 Tax=Aaosphaeria arxii CBS 175.79 TaxID=1450172 RepID=A0A6A5XDF8_9PLEO|nr:glycoside hydrolase family 37 protein [Aaosphaeria arxii CBS 175.79]KAF2010941.1 glycoside hydrolase family 37 protein [Aaosphaeria arxii CBS 175.79]